MRSRPIASASRPPSPERLGRRARGRPTDGRLVAHPMAACQLFIRIETSRGLARLATSAEKSLDVGDNAVDHRFGELRIHR